jgi:hypothetical protein
MADHVAFAIWLIACGTLNLAIGAVVLRMGHLFAVLVAEQMP